MRRRLLLLLGLGACAELTTPRPPEPPLELVGRVAANPLPPILDAAVMDFDRGGAGLVGHPAATALAVARLEWIGGEFRPGWRLSVLPDSFRFGAQRAVAEGREALGIALEATPEAAVAALLAAHRALARGDQRAVQAALAAPIFTGQSGPMLGRPMLSRPMLSRLNEPGAFPDAALATVAVRDEVARQMADGQFDRRVMFDTQPIGLSTTGLGPATGY